MIDQEFAGNARFHVTRRLGAGGMGVVYEAYDQERRDRIALKVLRRFDPLSLLRFKNEFRALADIAHPNLIPLYELIAEGGTWFFTMELIQGVDFFGYCWPSPAAPASSSPDADTTDDISPQGAGAAPRRSDEYWTRVRATFRGLAEGLSALHAAGKLHQDVKPSNVLVKPDGHVILLDYGLVAELVETVSWGDGVAGTPAYMAPERASGHRMAASDWYSAGLMLYEALTGERPFDGDAMAMLEQRRTTAPRRPRDVAQDVPADLDRLCMELLRTDPGERPLGPEVLQRISAPEHDTRRPRLASPAQVRFIGRSAHLSVLRRAYHDMRQGRCVGVHIRGPSGVGKSALVRRFLRQLPRGDGAVILAGRCYEGESIPYKAIDSLIDVLARHLIHLPRADAEAVMPRHVGALAQVFPVLQRVGAVAASLQDTSTVPDAAASRRRAFGALRELLARLADRRPVVIHIDDLQWGDVDSATLLSDVLQPPDPPPLLFLASYRSEHADRNECLDVLNNLRGDGAMSHWLELDVAPLDHADACAMARTLLGGAAASHAERIATDAGGNPYFISELARAARATRLVEPSASPDLDAIVLARVQALPEQARRLLEAVALAGQPLRIRQAYEAIDCEQLPHAPLRSLRAAHLVRTGRLLVDDWIETYHDRVRETVVRALPATAREALHWRLALALESTPGTDPEVIAGHFVGAGKRGRAGIYFARAAQAAAQSLAFDRAAKLYRIALEYEEADAPQAKYLRVQLADALANAGRGHDAGRAYEAASADAAGDEALNLQRQAATQYCIGGHISEGRQIFERLLRHVGMTLPSGSRATLATLLVKRAQLRLTGVRFRERTAAQIHPDDLRRIDLLWSVGTGLSLPDPLGVAAIQTQGLLLALRAGEPYRVARALAIETILTATGGWPTARRARALFDQAAALAERLDDPHALGLVRLAAGVTALLQTRFVDTLHECDKAIAILSERCTAVWWEVATARAMIVWSLWHQGRFRELGERASAYANEARDRGDLLTLTNLGAIVFPHLSLAADQPDRASRELDETLAQWTEDGFHIQHMAAVFSRAHIHLYRGDGAAALEHMNRSWPALQRALQLRSQIIRIMMLDLRARVALAAARDAPDPARLIARARGDAQSLHQESSDCARALSDSLMAAVALSEGNRVAAMALLTDAATAFDQLDLRLRAACARRHLGTLIGGEEGRALIAAADVRMGEEQILNPARMASTYLCGFSG